MIFFVVVVVLSIYRRRESMSAHVVGIRCRLIASLLAALASTRPGYAILISARISLTVRCASQIAQCFVIFLVVDHELRQFHLLASFHPRCLQMLSTEPVDQR